MRAKVGEARAILGPKTKELMVSSRTVARSRWSTPWPRKATHLRFHSTRCDRVPVFDIQKGEPFTSECHHKHHRVSLHNRLLELVILHRSLTLP